MPRETQTLRMSGLSSEEIYGLLSATVVPRPIAFVSTCDKSGVENLAPFSFFMVGGANPASLMYCPTLGSHGQQKDSLRNVLETGEFVVNLVHREMAEGMNATSADFPPDLSEWKVSGFTPVPSVAVRPPRIEESLVQFECRLFRVVEHGDGPGAARYVIGEVLVAHLDRSIAADPGIFRPISRLGGRRYLDLAELRGFEMQRPQK
jgi:flavin reductase (DIM6/NTAB) family NADH-FMN oxidoreductase RutF